MYMMCLVHLVFLVSLDIPVVRAFLVRQVFLVYLVWLVMMVCLDSPVHLDRNDDNDAVYAVYHLQFPLYNRILIFRLVHEDAYDEDVDDDVFFDHFEYLGYQVELVLVQHVMMLHLA